MTVDHDIDQSVKEDLPIELSESKTAQMDDILLEKLQNVFHQQTSTFVYHDLAKIASEHSPVDLAYAAPKLPPHARAILYENLSDLQAKINFIVSTDSSTRLAVFRNISDQEVKTLIENMPSDEAVWVLEAISEKRFRKVLDKLDPKKAARIKEIKKHERNTAGRLMTNEFFAFTMDITIGQAAAHIRNNPGIDLTRRIFVIDGSGILQGYVPARNLIINPDHLSLKQVMKPVAHKVTADTSREEVIEIVERYNISALTVVDENDKLIGVITYEDVIEAIEDIADETIASMAGTAEKLRDSKPLWLRFLSRAPWLIVTLFAGIINVGIMQKFQNYEEGLLTFVLFFVPLINGMSGNIGIQSSTILVRGMATGALTAGTRKEALKKELLTGFISAVLFGLACLILVSFLHLSTSPNLPVTGVQMGLMVGIGLFGACLAGSLIGVLSPLFFSRIGVDPAVAAGPIVTAFNDFFSMSIFFLIAIGLRGLLLG